MIAISTDIGPSTSFVSLSFSLYECLLCYVPLLSSSLPSHFSLPSHALFIILSSYCIYPKRRSKQRSSFLSPSPSFFESHHIKSNHIVLPQEHRPLPYTSTTATDVIISNWSYSAYSRYFLSSDGPDTFLFPPSSLLIEIRSNDTFVIQSRIS